MREFICEKCERRTREAHKYCPNCGSKNSIVKLENALEDIEENLPFIFPCYMDLPKTEIYRSLTKKLFGKDILAVGNIVGIQSRDIVLHNNSCKSSDFPSIKNNNNNNNRKGIKVFYVLDSSMNVRGPFFDKKEAKRVK